MILTRIAPLAAVAALLVGCSVADLNVQLQYAPDARITKVAAATPVTVFRFTDARGDEGDKGDTLRIGGVYNGYGIRLAKVMSPTPWPDALVEDLSSALTRRGVRTVSVPDRPYTPGSAVTTPLILAGEIRNFSTENRWMAYLAHVSGIVRVYDQSGALLVEKSVSARLRPDEEEVKLTDGRAILERLLNRTVADFVRQVVTDPDLSQRLVVGR